MAYNVILYFFFAVVLNISVGCNKSKVPTSISTPKKTDAILLKIDSNSYGYYFVPE